MKLVKIAAKKTMLAFDFKSNGEKVWALTSQKVYDYVKQNFKEGEDVTPTFSEEEKEGMKFCVVVKKGGQSSSTEPSTSDKPTCADCGKPVSDKKYRKCFDCNKKSPAKSTSTYTGKDNDLIKREAVAHATSRVMIGLAGHYDINDVGDVFKKVYKFILDLVDNK